jgi:hypothetical protein
MRLPNDLMSRRKKRNAPPLSPQEQLDLFMERGKELYDCRVRREGAGLRISLNMSWTAQDRELKSELIEPDDEDFRSYLLVFRKFISPDSPIYLSKVYDICHKHLDDEESNRYLAKARKIWNGFQSSARSDGISLEYRHRALSTMDNVRAWINGHYFHDDPACMKMLKTMYPYQRIASRYIFMNFVLETTRLINHLATHIRIGTENKSFKFS